MNQKYKFFIKTNAVTFRQSAEKQENNLQLTNYWIDRLLNLELSEDSVVELNDLTSFIQLLRSKLLFIKAGGGYVLNGHGQLLMIFRRGFWDLPKGKLDHGESIEQCAMREVEEECGIAGLTISSPPYSTFHLYQDQGRVVVKESVWFKMHTTDDRSLTPQTEEDIEEARWVGQPIPMPLINGTYLSIREVLDHFA